MIVTEAIHEVQESHNCAWTFETHFKSNISELSVSGREGNVSDNMGPSFTSKWRVFRWLRAPSRRRHCLDKSKASFHVHFHPLTLPGYCQIGVQLSRTQSNISFQIVEYFLPNSRLFFTQLKSQSNSSLIISLAGDSESGCINNIEPSRVTMSRLAASLARAIKIGFPGQYYGSSRGTCFPRRVLHTIEHMIDAKWNGHFMQP